jgi:hypothetical protein
MPLPPVDWPVRLKHLISGLQIISDHTEKKYCRMDIEVDAETLRLLNEFEAHARHRQVQIPLTDGSGCIRGEMNTLIGLGKASDPAKSSRVRISLHDVSTGECSDEPIRS